MARKSEGTLKDRVSDDGQYEINWTYLQRKGWIDEAVLTPRVANDGKVVMPDKQRNLLHRINDHYGSNNRAWPSIERLAQLMDCHRTTVLRAIEVLADRQILSVMKDESRKGNHNVYMIIWTELQILEPTRREAWLRMVFGDKKEGVKSRLGCDESRLGCDESRLGCDESRLGRPELLKNNSENKPKNKPLPSESDRPAHGGDPWQVVVVSLEKLGMGDKHRAASRAAERGMTPEQVLDWIQRFVQLTAANPSIHVGYLHKWLFGRGKPPWVELPPQARKPQESRSFSRSETERNERLFAAGRLRKALLAAGKSPAEANDEIVKAMSIGNVVGAVLSRIT